MVLGGFSSFVTSIVYYNALHSSALDTFRVFDDSGVIELLRREKEIRKHTDSFLRVSGMDWPDCGDLKRHLDYFKRYLEGKKSSHAFLISKILSFSTYPQR